MLKTTGLFVMVMLCAVAFRVEAGETMKPIGSISGTALRVIQAATPLLQENGLHLEHYLVSVFEEDSSYVVVFDDPNRPKGQRGSTASVQAFEVEVSKIEFRVIHAHFVR